MLTKTITYTDYNGEERTEDFLFNLTRAEIMEMELSKVGGLSETIQRITKTKDVPAIMDIFKELILKAYGEKSADGRRFVKSKQLSEEFSQTEAYSALFVELATDPTSASAFINGIMPVDTKQQTSSLEVVD